MRREQGRIQRERLEITRQEEKRAAQSLKATSGVIISKQDLENFDAGTILKVRPEQLDKGKLEKTQRIKALEKRLDHVDRAVRHHEIPKLQEQQRKMMNRKQKAWKRNWFHHRRRTQRLRLESAAPVCRWLGI